MSAPVLAGTMLASSSFMDYLEMNKGLNHIGFHYAHFYQPTKLRAGLSKSTADPDETMLIVVSTLQSSLF